MGKIKKKKLTEKQLFRLMEMIIGAKIDHKKFHKAHKEVGIIYLRMCFICHSRKWWQFGL